MISQKNSYDLQYNHLQYNQFLEHETLENIYHTLDIYNFLLRKNGYLTEDYSYLLFYHPQQVNPKGDVVFHKHLVKLDVSIKNAEKVFKDALKVLEGEMPKASEVCGFCRWCEESKI